MKLTAHLLVVLALLACSGNAAAPKERQPAGELVFTIEQGHHRVYEITDGALVADLGTGVLTARLNEGGDIAEAYLVGPEPEGVRRVKPGRPFIVTRVAAGPPAGSAAGTYRAALVPAPGLTSFVGQRNVLVVLWPDATLIGYQAGTEIWRRSAAGYLQVGQVGDLAVLHNGLNQTATVAPETGVITPLYADPDCGALGLLRGQIAGYCRRPSPGRILFGERVVPLPTLTAASAVTMSSFVTVSRDELYLYWESGDLCHLTDRVICRRLLPNLGPAALSPEGRILLAVDGQTIVEQHVMGDGQPRRSRSDLTYTAIGTSRDGTFVYALGAGYLDVWSLEGAGKRVRRYSAIGTNIEIIAGG